MKRMIYIMILLMFAVNVNAKNIYVNGKTLVPDTLQTGTALAPFRTLKAIEKVLADKDVVQIAAGIYDGDVIITKSDVEFDGGGTVTIKPVGIGAIFGILVKANGVKLRGITFDASDCDRQASCFNVRVEGDNIKGPECIDCTFKGVPAATYAKHQTSRGQMNYDDISTSTEYSGVVLTRVDFLNVKEALPSILEKAVSDTTIVQTKLPDGTSTVTVSATDKIAVIEIGVPR